MEKEKLPNWSFVQLVIILFAEKNILKLENITFSLIKTPYCNTNLEITIYALLSNFWICWFTHFFTPPRTAPRVFPFAPPCGFTLSPRVIACCNRNGLFCEKILGLPIPESWTRLQICIQIWHLVVNLSVCTVHFKEIWGPVKFGLKKGAGGDLPPTPHLLGWHCHLFKLFFLYQGFPRLKEVILRYFEMLGVRLKMPWLCCV